MKTEQRKTWSIPKIESFAGPDQLVDVFIDWRKWNQRGSKEEQVCPSKETVRTLINLSYYASQAQEEGRYPRFRIYVPMKRIGNNLRKLATFDPPVHLDGVDTLRRLAPAASSLDYALSVVEAGERLLCDGIVSAADDESGIVFGRPEVAIGGRPPGLFIRIDRPGEIRITDGLASFLLRHGKVRDIIPFFCVPGVHDWISESAENIHEAIFKNLVDGHKNFGGQNGIRHLVLQLLSKILAEAVENRTGATFIVLPDPNCPSIKCKYKLREASLADAIKRFWKDCIKTTSTNDVKQLKNLGRVWNASHRKLFTAAKAVATFSKVDGCVLMDRLFNVYGFGGKIQVDEKPAEESGLEYADYDSKETISEEELHSFGTRHQSAFRLCKAVKDAIVFVVSQDGDLRIFFSDSKKVYFFDALHAWAKNMPSW